MAIRVYNTLHNKKEEFVPVEEGKVKMYVCGPTTYNYIHLGNARPIVAFDVVRRYFGYRGYDVTYIQNFTDVDDKIIKRANEEGMDPKDLADKYIEAYFEDSGRLGVQKATVHPRVTDHMDDIIAMVQKIIDNGYGYEVNGDVYFEVRKFKPYGKLSGRSIDEMQSGARIAVGEQKKDPLDFALWKAAKPGEPYWESPWGKGRPGWHIECSAMSKKYLGDTFDIHGGGADLIFPHHENEIAQSEGCTGHPFVHYWLHNGFITINQEKMSKSLNNFFLVKDVLEKYSPDALRFFLLSTHYRSPLDFSDERLDEAERNMERLTDVIAKTKELAKTEGNEETAESRALSEAADKALAGFKAAMDDDFNTGLASGFMFDLAKAINVYYTAVHNGTAHNQAAAQHAKDVLKTIMDILGILEKQWKDTESASSEEYEALMNVILSIRQEARKEKMYKIADAIRDKLGEIGIIIEDSPTGARWKKRGI